MQTSQSQTMIYDLNSKNASAKIIQLLIEDNNFLLDMVNALDKRLVDIEKKFN